MYNNKPIQCLQISYCHTQTHSYVFDFAPFVNKTVTYTVRVEQSIEKYGIRQGDPVATENQHPEEARHMIKPDKNTIYSGD